MHSLDQALLLDFLQSDAISSGQEIAQQFVFLFQCSDIKKCSPEVKKVFKKGIMRVFLGALF